MTDKNKKEYQEIVLDLLKGTKDQSLIQDIRKSYLVKTGKKNLYKPHKGRKKTDKPKRTSFIISCYPDELIKVKELAAAENMKISEYVLKKIGIR